MAVRRELVGQRALRAERDRRLAADILGRYVSVWQALRGEVNALTASLEADRLAGLPVNAVTVRRRLDFQRLLRRVEEEVRRAAQATGAAITGAQLAAVMQGGLDAEMLMVASLGAPPAPYAVWTPARPGAAALQLAGFSSSGAPLGQLLGELGPAAAASVRDSLLSAVIIGKNPVQTARDIRTALGGNTARALTIARTETLRAYREATRLSYAENRDVVNGWSWHATLDGRTCEVCWAMHGSRFDVEEPLGSHPNCRCAMVPVTKGWGALGFPNTLPDTSYLPEPGPLVFARQPVGVQRRVLGPGKLAAYQAGQLGLSDLVRVTRSPRFGEGRAARSLRDALALARAA